MSVCASAEDGVREKAGRGATRSRPLGLGSCGSVNREAAGEAEQAAETTPGRHQRQTGRNTQTTVSNIKKTEFFTQFYTHSHSVLLNWCHFKETGHWKRTHWRQLLLQIQHLQQMMDGTLNKTEPQSKSTVVFNDVKFNFSSSQHLNTSGWCWQLCIWILALRKNSIR